MVLLFSTTLGLSIVGMTVLLALKRYELMTGRMFFQNLRPGLNTIFHETLTFMEHQLPAFIRTSVEQMVMYVVRMIQRLVAQTILLVEYWLQRILDMLRMTSHTSHSSLPASAFLREVAEHKKSLIKRSRIKRVVPQE